MTETLPPPKQKVTGLKQRRHHFPPSQTLLAGKPCTVIHWYASSAINGFSSL